jgi:release factor glutamine methyltransferase
LFIDRRVLIPRPETETVVEEALRELADTIEPVVVDLGAGSGAIALSIAAETRDAQVWAVDASEGACAVARANLAGLGGMAATRVRILQGEWYEPLPDDLRGNVDLVVSNPPYIADDEDLPREVVDWEPRDALIAGPRGTEAIEAILGQAPAWLRRPGAAVIEIAPHQAGAAQVLALQAGFDDAEVRPDLTGRDRTLIARIG